MPRLRFRHWLEPLNRERCVPTPSDDGAATIFLFVQRQKITVRLAPKLENERIRAESVRLKEAETKKQSETKEKDSSHKTDVR